MMEHKINLYQKYQSLTKTILLIIGKVQSMTESFILVIGKVQSLTESFLLVIRKLEGRARVRCGGSKGRRLLLFFKILRTSFRHSTSLVDA